VLRQKWSRGQVQTRFANMPPCLIGMEASARTRGRRSQQRSRSGRETNGRGRRE
jgi:hypothetical protein